MPSLANCWQPGSRLAFLVPFTMRCAPVPPELGGGHGMSNEERRRMAGLGGGSQGRRERKSAELAQAVTKRGAWYICKY